VPVGHHEGHPVVERDSVLQGDKHFLEVGLAPAAIDRCEPVGSTMQTTFTRGWCNPFGSIVRFRAVAFPRWQAVHPRSAQIHHLGGVPSGCP